MKKTSAFALSLICALPLNSQESFEGISSPFVYVEEPMFYDCALPEAVRSPFKETSALEVTFSETFLLDIALDMIEGKRQNLCLDSEKPSYALHQVSNTSMHQKGKGFTPSQLEMAQYHYYRVALSKEPDIDYQVGSDAWSKDILSAFAKHREQQFAKGYFAPSDRAFLEKSLDLYLTRQAPELFVPIKPVENQKPLLVNSDKPLNLLRGFPSDFSLREREFGAYLTSLNQCLPSSYLGYDIYRSFLTRGYAGQKERIPTYSVGSTEWGDDILSAYTVMRDVEYANILFHEGLSTHLIINTEWEKCFAGNLKKIADDLTDSYKTNPFHLIEAKITHCNADMALKREKSNATIYIDSNIELIFTMQRYLGHIASDFPAPMSLSTLVERVKGEEEQVIIHAGKHDLSIPIALEAVQYSKATFSPKVASETFTQSFPKTQTALYTKYTPEFIDFDELPSAMRPIFQTMVESHSHLSAPDLMPAFEDDRITVFTYQTDIQLKSPNHELAYISPISFDPSEAFYRTTNFRYVNRSPEKNFQLALMTEDDISLLSELVYEKAVSQSNENTLLVYPKYNAKSIDQRKNIYERNNEIAPFAIASPKICHQAILQSESIALPSLFEDFGVHILSAFQTLAKEGIFPNQTMLETSFSVRLVDSYAYDINVSPYVFDMATPIKAKFQDDLISAHTTSGDMTNVLPTERAQSETFFFEEEPTGSLLLGKSPISDQEGLANGARSVNRSLRLIHLSLLQLPTLEELACDSLGDDFSVRVKILPKMSQDGYVFKAQIKPYDKDGLYTLPHHIYFLVDCSRKIEAHRFETFKKGILQAINYLDANAKFHIIALGGEAKELSPEGLRPTRGAHLMAKKFLSRLNQTSNVKFDTFMRLVNELQTKGEHSEEIHAAVLLSNGGFMKNIRMHRESLNREHANASNAFALHTASISDNNNQTMMNWIAKLHHGEALHCATHASFPRKFAIMLKHLKRPLAYDVHLSAFNTNDSVNFYHDANHAPHLYCDKGYTFYGTTDELKDTNVILQGKSGEKWLNIPITLPLDGASRGRVTLEKQIAEQKAFLDVIRFIQDNEPEAFFSAQESLAPYNLIVK